MPELPDLTVYIKHLDRRVTGEALQDIRLASPFVLRTVSPTIEEVRDRVVTGLRRLAKQIVFELEGGFFVVIHLMVAGRLQWRGAAKATPKSGRHRNALAAFDFSSGTLLFTETGRKKRASLRLVRGEDGLAALDPGGLDVFATDLADFVRRLRESRHTLKRTLTDQRIFAGIGNAYSDEILLHTGLSPFKRARDVKDEEAARLFDACLRTLADRSLSKLLKETCRGASRSWKGIDAGSNPGTGGWTRTGSGRNRSVLRPATQQTHRPHQSRRTRRIAKQMVYKLTARRPTERPHAETVPC